MLTLKHNNDVTKALQKQTHNICCCCVWINKMKNLNKKLCVRAADNSLANLAFIYTKRNTERSLYTQKYLHLICIFIWFLWWKLQPNCCWNSETYNGWAKQQYILLLVLVFFVFGSSFVALQLAHNFIFHKLCRKSKQKLRICYKHDANTCIYFWCMQTLVIAKKGASPARNTGTFLNKLTTIVKLMWLMDFTFHQVIKITCGVGKGWKKGCLITLAAWNYGRLQHFRFYSYQNANLINLPTLA